MYRIFTPLRTVHAINLILFILSLAFLVSALLISSNAHAQTPEELREHIKLLEKQVDTYENAITKKQQEANTLKNKLDIVKQNILKKELEIKKTNLVIKKIDLDIKEKQSSLDETGLRIALSERLLAQHIQNLYKLDQHDAIVILVKNSRISNFFNEVQAIEGIQQKTSKLLNSYHTLKVNLQLEKTTLEEDKEEAVNIKGLAELQRRNLDKEKREHDTLLKATKGQEAEYQKLLKDKKTTLATLKSQLFYLEATGVSAEDALTYAGLAASRAGIRTAFLLAVLEVETGRQFANSTITVGTNLGTGNWKTDMYDCYIKLGKRSYAEQQKKAYFEIIDSLRYDPEKMPVSRKPRYGCGGAMGPAQFLPSTWHLFSERVAALTGKNPPDPWKVETAFMASALYLADSGATAKTTSAERAAAKTYISGRPTCRTYTCNIYSNNIISLSRVIEDAL